MKSTGSQMPCTRSMQKVTKFVVIKTINKIHDGIYTSFYTTYTKDLTFSHQSERSIVDESRMAKALAVL